MNKYSYNIRAEWKNRVESPSRVSREFLQTLDALDGVDPIFGNWHLVEMGADDTIPIEEVKSQIELLVDRNAFLDDDGEIDPDQGYLMCAITGETSTATTLTFSVTAGGKYDNEVKIEAGGYNINPDPAIVTYPVFKGSLLEIVRIWSPGWANAYAFDMTYSKEPTAPGCPQLPYSMFHMAWMSYLPAPFADGLDLPADIPTERTPDGGILMIAAEERLDPTNPEHMRRSKIIAETMIGHLGADGQKIS